MQTIYIDISNKSILPTIYAKQGDIGRKFKAVVLENSVSREITVNEHFSAGYDGASGSGNYETIGERSAFEVYGNVVTVELAPNMLQAPGLSNFCLTMNSEDGNVIGLWNIVVDVEETPGFLGDPIKDYYPGISAVLYVDQNLSEKQKEKARANIGSGTGNVKTVNGIAPDENGNVVVAGGSGIHIDPEPPTDPNIKVWIDTDEEAEVPGCDSSGGVSGWEDFTERNVTEFFPEGAYPLDPDYPVELYEPDVFVNFKGTIEVGKKYIVNFDGTQYELVGTLCPVEAACNDFGGEEGRFVYIGNPAMVMSFGGTDDGWDDTISIHGLDTGEPFCFWMESPGEGDAYLYIRESYGAGKSSIVFGIKEVTETVNPIPDEYLPDYLPKEEVKKVNTTFGGVVGDRESMVFDSNSGAYIVKMSPKYLSADELVGATITCWNSGTFFTVHLIPEMLVDVSAQLGVPSVMMCLGNGNNVALSTQYDTTLGEMTISAGTWFVYIPMEFHVVSISCLPSYEEEVVRKLDEKFLPEVGVNSEPFYINDAYGEGTITNAGYFFFAENDRMNEQMKSGVIAIEFDFIPIGGSEASKHSVVMTGDERRAFCLFSSGEVLYMAEMMLKTNVLPQFSVIPMKAKRSGSVITDKFNFPITLGKDYSYYTLRVDESGNVVAGKLI